MIGPEEWTWPSSPHLMVQAAQSRASQWVNEISNFPPLRKERIDWRLPVESNISMVIGLIIPVCALNIGGMRSGISYR